MNGTDRLVVEILETVLSILTLEYHNRIYLSYDVKRLNEEKRKLLQRALDCINNQDSREEKVSDKVKE